MQLNPQQERVANHVRGRILTIAGPGSGKTRTLTERTARLIAGAGVDPGNILCLTFTNKARDEMRERIAARLGGAGSQAAKRVTISNFHGLCGVVLRRLGGPLGYGPGMTVIDADDQVDLILQLARMRGLEPTKPQARLWAMMANDWRENLWTTDEFESRCADRLTDGGLGTVKAYVQSLRTRNQCDFSGLLSETARLLRDHPDVRGRLQMKFRFIQVDEYQDTNRAQNEIVELLASEEDNLLAVGDADQSIYEWRGASPDAIKDFIRNGERKTGKCVVAKLGLNYRSTPQIIEVADRLIRHCAGRIPVEFSTVHKPGELPKCVGLKTPEDEAEVVAQNIQAVIRDGGTLPREIAVFYRTNDMSRLVEQALAKRQIPYTVVGSGSYYDRMEVKDVLSMLRFVCNPRDGIAFHRIANKPSRGMSDSLVGRLEAFAERHNMDLLTAMSEMSLERIAQSDGGKPLTDGQLRACRAARTIFGFDTSGMSVAQVLVELLERTQYNRWLQERYDDKGEYEDRSRNVGELANAVAVFCQASPRATIADYLQSIALYTSDQGDGDDPHGDGGVRLMSLHASKGLEFDVVYMIGVEHGILPHEKAVKDRGERGIDEERRLCYVGFTRARKILRVTWCKQRQDAFARGGKTARFKPSLPSRFLLEAGLLSAEEYQAAVDETLPPVGRRSRGGGR